MLAAGSRRGRAGATRLRDLSARRGLRTGRSDERGRGTDTPRARRVARTRRRPLARSDEGTGEGGGDGAVPRRRARRAGRDGRHRGRCRRARSERHRHRGRVALRSRAVAPTTRPGRTKRRAELTLFALIGRNAMAITDIGITDTADFADGYEFGQAGAYVRIKGVARGALD